MYGSKTECIIRLVRRPAIPPQMPRTMGRRLCRLCSSSIKYGQVFMENTILPFMSLSFLTLQPSRGQCTLYTCNNRCSPESRLGHNAHLCWYILLELASLLYSSYNRTDTSKPKASSCKPASGVSWSSLLPHNRTVIVDIAKLAILLRHGQATVEWGHRIIVGRDDDIAFSVDESAFSVDTDRQWIISQFCFIVPVKTIGKAFSWQNWLSIIFCVSILTFSPIFSSSLLKRQ